MKSYTEEKDLINSIKYKHWIFFDWIKWIFLYDNEKIYLNSMKRCIELQRENLIDFK